MGDTVVVTGANRGIGLEFVKLYLAQGAEVYALCRQSSAALEQTGAIVVEGIDVSAGDVGLKLKRALEGVTINVLINNAGVLRDEQLGTINYETLLDQFMINAVGPLRVAEALVPQMPPGAKLALITSRMGSIADNGSGGRYGYRMSKAALNAAGMSLAKDLEPKQVAVAILHPGYVQTDMVGGRGDISAPVAAERLSARIAELNINNTGTFWHSSGEVLPW